MAEFEWDKTKASAHEFPSSRRLLPLALILVVYATAAIAAMSSNSPTFDELLLPSAGARGYATGDFDLARLYHPRVPAYLYGLPIFLSSPEFPEEGDRWGDRMAFPYSNLLFFEGGRDPHILLNRSRLVAVGVSVLLIILVFAFSLRHHGLFAAVLAAAMTAFLPDVLGHGAIAYNDIAGGLTIFGAVWALDRAGSTLRARDVIFASLLTALALCVKYSAVILAPIAGGIIVLESVRRGASWRRYLVRALSLFLLGMGVVYLGIVAIYLGDFSLESFRAGLQFNLGHALAGHVLPHWFLGRLRPEPVWYFFPAAFLIKTPIVFHLLIGVAAWGAFRARKEVLALLQPPLRGPILALLLIGASLLTASLQIGFRHAFPALPFLIVLTAAGVTSVAARWGRPARIPVGILVVLQAAIVLSWHPHYLPYVSEYVPDRDRGYRLIADSSLDWGQGLPALREFIETEGADGVYLSYFGSVPPEAFGIRYEPLPSFFPLPTLDDPPIQPRHVVISATNLGGAYIEDALAEYRGREPDGVLARTLLVYDLQPEAREP